ncbi:hypothetical protein [Synoicihabitans lomoniglobus]|uniref:Uncharacterized protein n=1 Tax=Synoicihabitans lomoniglobus TaxID=2909285 RepID=A0AAF0CS34_9BACT|nr:hypothetical protein [Opitutaceae bacterium LMO-M01]WED67008.1 hypothetical protein PXH66_09110 [Opitutaceae bacterium LMO-M01]
MSWNKLNLWVQVTLEDTVSEFFYAPLFVTILATVLCYFDVIPFPYEIVLSSVVLLGVLLGFRALWVLNFINHAEPTVAHVGVRLGRFRKWVEHEMQVGDGTAAFDTKHTFLKNEVTEGEPVWVMVHHRKKKRILIIKRLKDKDSLVG